MSTLQNRICHMAGATRTFYFENLKIFDVSNSVMSHYAPFPKEHGQISCNGIAEDHEALGVHSQQRRRQVRYIL